MATRYRLADQWIVLGNSRLADGTHPVQPCRSQEPAPRKPGRDDLRLAVDELGIKTFPLQSTSEVTQDANVGDLATADPSSMSGLTRLYGHQDGREQAKL